MNIYFSDHFLKSVRQLPDDIKKSLKEKLGYMVDDPKHPSLRTKKIKGNDKIFEASITMNIRMTWEYYEDGLLLRNIGGHDKTLNNP